MKYPAHGGGNTYYIISRGAKNLEFAKIKVFTKITKIQKIWNI